MMVNVIISLVSAIFGAIFGGLTTWKLARHSAFIDRCLDRLERACDELEHYQSCYGQLYVEYLSPIAQESRGPWIKDPSSPTDTTYLELERRVDESRGRLRTHAHLLRAILPKKFQDGAYKAIDDVLRQSSPQHQRDSTGINHMAQCARNQLVQMMGEIGRLPLFEDLDTFHW